MGYRGRDVLGEEAGYSSAKLRWWEYLTLDLWWLDRVSGGREPHPLVVILVAGHFAISARGVTVRRPD